MDIWQIENVWEITAAIATGFTALFVLGAGIAAVWQLREHAKLRKQQALDSMLGLWEGEKERKYRRYVIRDFEFNEGDNLEKMRNERTEDLDKVELILGICDRTG